MWICFQYSINIFEQQTMGKVHSIQQLEVAAPSYPGEWILQGNTNYCQLVKNADTGFIAQQYIVPADPRIPLTKTYEVYDYRRRQNQNLVEVYQVERESPAYICQGGDYLRIKTQRIPARLSDVKISSEEEAFYILQQALVGYRTIFNFQGPIIVNDDMIGFNQNGQVKVWLNNNFAKNSPDGELNPPRYQQNTYHASGITNQGGMVSQVVDVIQEHIDPTLFSGFMNHFYSKSPRTFTEALQLVRQYTTARGIRPIQKVGFISGLQTVNTTSINLNFTSLPLTVNNAHQTTQSPTQQMLVTQPSINRSIQAPTQPYIIQNFAPSSTTITYEQQNPISYITQQPIRQIILTPQSYPSNSYIGAVASSIPQPLVYPVSSIVTPRSSTVLPQQQYVHHINHQIPALQSKVPTISQPLSYVQSYPKQIAKPLVQSSFQNVVTSYSQITPNNIRLNEVIQPSSQIVTPFSQVVVPRNETQRVNYRASQPSTKIIRNEPRTSPNPYPRRSVNHSPQPIAVPPTSQIINGKSNIIRSNRNPSPPVIRSDISPKRNLSPLSIQKPKAVATPVITQPKNVQSIVIAPQNVNSSTILSRQGPTQSSNQVKRISPSRNQFRKQHVNDTHPTHNIERVLQGVRKTNSINDPIIDILSPTLVTAKPQQQIEKTQNKTNNQIVVQNTIMKQKEDNIVPFQGLPHRRSNIHQVIAPNNQIGNIQIKKQPLITQQNTSTTVNTNANINIPTKPQVVLVDKNIGIQKQVVQTNKPAIVRPQVLPHPNSLFASFNYQPFNQPSTIIKNQKSIFEIGDHVANNISGIQHRGGPITVASGVSTFTNPLENRAQVNTTQFAQVRSLAANDSVNPEIRKIMMLPKTNNFIVEQTNIIQNIPLAESHQQFDVASQQVRNIQVRQNFQNVPTDVSPFTIEETIVAEQVTYGTGNGQILQVNHIISGNQHVGNDGQITKNDLWNSNDSVPVVPKLSQDIRLQQQEARINNNLQHEQQHRVVDSLNNADLVNQVRIENHIISDPVEVSNTRLDIESMMRRHNQENRHLFEKYEQYQKNIQKQFSPLTPTSPSSIPHPTQFRYGGDSQDRQIKVENQSFEHQNQRQFAQDNREATHHQEVVVNNQVSYNKETYKREQYIQSNQQQLIIQERVTHYQNIDPALYNNQIQTHEVVYENRGEYNPYSQNQYYQSIRNERQSPQSVHERGYQYVTSEQPSPQIHTYISHRQNQGYPLRQQVEQSINFKETIQSYDYEQQPNQYVAHQYQGSAPTYQELRAALLQSSNALNRDSEPYEEYRAEYHYETTTYDSQR